MQYESWHAVVARGLVDGRTACTPWQSISIRLESTVTRRVWWQGAYNVYNDLHQLVSRRAGI